MESNGKRYIRNDSANCAHIVEETNGRNVRVDPHERLRALLNAPDDDTEDPTPPPDAPKFGTVIHNRIFVGGFSLTATDEDLWKFFSGFASVTAARVIYDRAGVSKCYGFVTFASPKHARLIVKQSGGVMFSPLGRLRIAQAVRKQMSQLPMLGEVTPQGGPFCYQLLPYAPYPPPTLALYPVPYEGAPMYAAAPSTQYTLVPAPYSTPMQPGVQLPQAPCPCETCCMAAPDKPPRAPSVPLHPAYIY